MSFIVFSRHEGLLSLPSSRPEQEQSVQCSGTFAFEKIHGLERRNKGAKKVKTLKLSQARNIYITYPPTPLAAGGARQRRNYQQQGPRSHYKQQGQEARKQERRSKKQFPQARSVPQGPAVWLWRRRRFGSDS